MVTERRGSAGAERHENGTAANPNNPLVTPMGDEDGQQLVELMGNDNKGSVPKIWAMGFIMGLGAFLFGYDSANLNGPLTPGFNATIPFANSSVMVGSLQASALAGAGIGESWLSTKNCVYYL